jgi:NTP pyrophosphatase (non-canonical NTP hydrolase)
MTISDFQRHIESIYLEKDRARGLDADFRWFIEEVGELAKALRETGGLARTQAERSEAAGVPVPASTHLTSEFADVFAWLSTLASLSGVSLEEAVQKYAHGCPKCGQTPCGCG